MDAGDDDDESEEEEAVRSSKAKKAGNLFLRLLYALNPLHLI